MSGIEARLAEVLADLRRPPCWGPNDQGQMMVDMSVEDYHADLDALAVVVAEERERVAAAIEAQVIPLEEPKADDHPVTVRNAVLGLAARIARAAAPASVVGGQS